MLRENREHGSQIIVFLNIHVGVHNASVLANRWTTIVNMGHTFCTVTVDTPNELVQLVLQINQFNIDIPSYFDGLFNPF
jgi:hypothetical protein